MVETPGMRLRAQVARLEERNAALEAALEHLADTVSDYPLERATGSDVADAIGDARAVLSDTGEGWLPPEVREPAIRALRFESSLTVHSQFHSGYRDGSQQDCPCCREAHAALAALEEK